MNTETFKGSSFKAVDHRSGDRMKDISSNPMDLLIRTYPKRFLILILFCLYSASNAFQWLQYAIITRKVSIVYGVSDLAINMTSMLYMLIFIPGMLPASWILNAKGLRFSILLGSFGTFLGSAIKCASPYPQGYPITLLGQILVAVCNLFVISIPPRLAAIWFSEKEVASATSIGVFGNQLGICAGFFLPPAIVTSNLPDVIFSQLSSIFYGTAVFTGCLFILIYIFFDDHPFSPPSVTAAKAQVSQDINFLQSVKFLVTDQNMILLTLSYGINVGVFYAISTVLDEMIFSAHPGEESAAGHLGAIITVVGTIGAAISGWILDKTQRYKETTLILYFFSLIGLLGFTLALYISLSLAYFVAGFLGFFMTGYLPIGFEYAAELTYPYSEGTSAGLLNLSAQFFGIILCFTATIMMKKLDYMKCNGLLVLFLFVGLLMTAKIKGSLKRKEASKVMVTLTSP